MEQTVQMHSAVVSDRGLSDKRPQNEDSYLNMPQLGLFAVADGVGGAQAGEVASQMAMEILAEAFANANGAEVEATMRAALDRANLAIYQMANELPQLSSMATTVVAVQLTGDTATLAHVGDSRAYRFTPDGRLERETNDHSVVEEEVRAGRMTPEEAAVHPGRNVISRALGAEETVEIELRKLKVEPGTGFLLCSDGITRHIDDSELAGILSGGLQPQETCLRLKELCFERGAEDNLTAVVVNVPRNAEFAASPDDPEATISDIQLADTESDIRFDDTEEVTISTARSPFDSTVDETDEKPEFDEYIDDFQATEARNDDESLLMTEDEAHLESADEEAKEASWPVDAPATVATPVSESAPAATVAPSHAASRSDVPVRRTGGATRILSSAILLLLGAAAGFGGYYAYQASQPAPVPVVEQQPVITEMKSTKPALTAFEEGRRQVDADPAKYLAANPVPQDAEDLFLTGRAYLLTGKYWEAKRAFNDAKTKLKPEDENSRTLSSEISMALAIIENPKATENFQREVVSQYAPANSNTTQPAVR